MRRSRSRHRSFPQARIGIYIDNVEVILKLVFYILCILLPLHMLLMREFDRWMHAENIRREGVIVRRFDALDDASEVIGSYRGANIHRTVTFHGMRYEFSGVFPPGRHGALHRDELYLDPGLLYISCDGS
jgi:hypothetical protein